jgi:hypothetical protein
MVALVTIVAIAVIGVGVWFFGRHLNSSTPSLQIRWTPLCVVALIVGAFLLIVRYCIHEERVIGRAVADALGGRDRLTDEEFGKRYYAKDLAPLAAQLRRMLADNLGCELSGMIPSDDFEKWLDLSSSPDSVADTFFEDLAIELQLTRDSPWPERFGTFDALVRFVAEHAHPPKAH